MSSLIWVQTVCNGHQQMALVGKKLKVQSYEQPHKQQFPNKINFELGLNELISVFISECQSICLTITGHHDKILNSFISTDISLKSNLTNRWSTPIQIKWFLPD